jgi:hypothetical protein
MKISNMACSYAVWSAGTKQDPLLSGVEVPPGA